MKKYKSHLDNWPDKSEKFYRDVYVSEFGNLLNNKQNRVLEIGFGKGHFLNVLKGSGYKNVEGVEIDNDLYSYAVARELGFKLFNIDGIDFLRKNKSKYDLIFVIDVLEHIPLNNLSLFLSLLNKNLNKNGVCVIRTVNAESVLTGSFMRYIDSTHLNSFTRFSIMPLLAESGFKNILIRKQFFHKGLIYAPVRFVRFIIELYCKFILSFYFGAEAFSSIQTPNIIVYAKK